MTSKWVTYDNYYLLEDILYYKQYYNQVGEVSRKITLVHIS